MKKLRLKLILMTLIFLVSIIISASVFATNEGIQILKKSEREYMIYISQHLDTSFEFAFSNDKGVNKDELTFKVAATDTAESGANYIAYIDDDLYTKFFSNTTYLWARTIEGKYFAEGIEIDLSKAIEEKDVELANNITQKIKVDTKNSITTEKIEKGVKITKTVGKVDILEKGKIYYQLVKLPSSESYNKFMEIAEKIANSKIENNMYAKLEATSQFAQLYEELVPKITDNKWIEVKDGVILQPEESKNGEQYILWLKAINEDEENEKIKIDAQFLTCFEDYNYKVISEKVATKLPITYDNPILFIALVFLVIALVSVVVLKIKTTKKEETKK